MAGDIFSKAFSLCPDAIIISRPHDGLILAINEGFTQLTGYTEADVRGRTVADLQLWVNPEDRRHLLGRLRSGAEVRDFTAEIRLENGLTKPGSLSARLVVDGDGESLLCYIRDLSERAMADDALRQYHEAAFMLENPSPGP